MNAADLLTQAMSTGHLVRGADVSAATWPEAARTYLADGSGLAWQVAADLRTQGRFVVDAEIVAPVRPSFVRRYGIRDEVAFARAWTLVEVWAKLFDVPVITWLARYGIDKPTDLIFCRRLGEIGWATRRSDDVAMTFGVITVGERADDDVTVNF